MRSALVYLIAITLAEILTAFVSPLPGIILHITIMTGLIIHSSLPGQQANRELFLSLILVPLIRIISLSMPLASIPQVWWYPVIYVPLLVAAVQVIFLLKLNRENLGLTFGHLSWQTGIALSGLVIGFGEYFILRNEAEITSRILGETWLLSAFFLIVFTGFIEELTFRGILQYTAERTLGKWGIVYVSLLFAVVHLIHTSLWDIVFVFIVALYFGWAVKKTGSLLGVTLSHGIANICLFLVAPLIF